MTGKKKINLGPLPEELDYSKYEVTVTRWDRIIGVMLLVMLVLALLVYFLISPSTVDVASHSDDTPLPITAEASSAEQPDKEEAAGDAVSEVADTVVQSKAEALTEAETVTKTEASAPFVETEAPVAAQAEIQQPSESTSVESTVSINKQAFKPVAETAEKTVLAEVKVLNPAITQAILTDELANDEPGSALSDTLILPASGITKVMLFTDMKGLRGKTLYHDWYRNGERQARVKIPVSLKSQRSFSSKFINLQMTGDWQVKVVDGKDNTYVDATFHVSAL